METAEELQIVSAEGADEERIILNSCREELERKDVAPFHPYYDLASHLWHYEVTGGAIEEVFSRMMGPRDRYSGLVLPWKWPATLGAGEYLKAIFPESLLGVTAIIYSSALQESNTVEVSSAPFIQNLRSVDFLIGVDGNESHELFQLFQEGAADTIFKTEGKALPSIGLDGVYNMVPTIKLAKYLELSKRDILFTILTPSSDLYQPFLEKRGADNLYS